MNRMAIKAADMLPQAAYAEIFGRARLMWRNARASANKLGGVVYPGPILSSELPELEALLGLAPRSTWQLRSTAQSLLDAGFTVSEIDESLLTIDQVMPEVNATIDAGPITHGCSHVTETKWRTSDADDSAAPSLTYDTEAHRRLARLAAPSSQWMRNSPYPPHVCNNYNAWIALHPGLWTGDLGRYLRSQNWGHCAPVRETKLLKSLSSAATKYTTAIDYKFGVEAAKALIGFNQLLGWVVTPTETLSKRDPGKPFSVLAESLALFGGPKVYVGADTDAAVAAMLVEAYGEPGKRADLLEFLTSTAYSTSGGSGYVVEIDGERWSLTKGAALLGPLVTGVLLGSDQPTLALLKLDVSNPRVIYRAPTALFVRTVWLRTAYRKTNFSTTIGLSEHAKWVMLSEMLDDQSGHVRASMDVQGMDGTPGFIAARSLLLAPAQDSQFLKQQTHDALSKVRFVGLTDSDVLLVREAEACGIIWDVTFTDERTVEFQSHGLWSGHAITSELGTLLSLFYQCLVFVVAQMVLAGPEPQLVTAGDDSLARAPTAWHAALAMRAARLFNLSYSPTASITGRRCEFLRCMMDGTSLYRYSNRAIARATERPADASIAAGLAERLAESVASVETLFCRMQTAVPAWATRSLAQSTEATYAVSARMLSTPARFGGAGVVGSLEWAVLAPRPPVPGPRVPAGPVQMRALSIVRRYDLPASLAPAAEVVATRQLQAGMRNRSVQAALGKERRAWDRSHARLVEPLPYESGFGTRTAAALALLPAGANCAATLADATEPLPQAPWVCPRDLYDVLMQAADAVDGKMRTRLDMLVQYAPAGVGAFISANRSCRGSVLLMLVSGQGVGAWHDFRYPLGDALRGVISARLNWAAAVDRLFLRVPTLTDALVSAATAWRRCARACYTNPAIRQVISA